MSLTLVPAGSALAYMVDCTAGGSVTAGDATPLRLVLCLIIQP